MPIQTISRPTPSENIVMKNMNVAIPIGNETRR